MNTLGFPETIPDHRQSDDLIDDYEKPFTLLNIYILRSEDRTTRVRNFEFVHAIIVAAHSESEAREVAATHLSWLGTAHRSEKLGHASLKNTKPHIIESRALFRSLQ